MARLTLAHPVFLAEDPVELAAASPYFPLGLLYLAAYVRREGFEVNVFDGTFEAGASAFEAHLNAHRPDIVGISSVISSREAALDLAARTRARGIPVVLGGPDPTLDPATYLADPNVDIVVHHEGEQTMAALLECVDAGRLEVDQLRDMPGVAFRLDGRVQVNAPRAPIQDLDTLPEPARDLIDMSRYLEHWDATSGYTSVTVSTSRGCPFGCDWCRDAVHGADFRQRSPQSVAAEVKAIGDAYGPSSIRLVDDVDGLERSWLESWADETERLDAAIPFEPLHASARPDLPLLEVRDSL